MAVYGEPLSDSHSMAETYAANTEPMLSHINVGTGTDVSIRELAEKVAEVAGYTGRIETDPAKPNGTPRKLMNVDRLRAMGWQARIPLDEGLATTYRWYLDEDAHKNTSPGNMPSFKPSTAR